MNKIKLIYLLLIVSLSLSAQDNPQQFSLEEAIDYALKNNRIAKNAEKDIAAAKQQKWETTAIGLPQVNVTINYQNFLKQQISLVPAEFFGGNPGEFAEVIFGTQQNVNATATINQLLFDGSYLVGLQSAKVFLEISENAKIKTDLEIRKSVINAYGNVLLAEESVAIFEKNIAVLEKNVNDTQKIYENGLGDEESVEQLQITLSGLKSNLANAKRLQSIAYQMLNITLGIEFNQPTILTDNLESLTLKHIDLQPLVEENDVTKNIDYRIAENDKVSKELLLKLEKSKALPQLSAYLNGGYLGFSDEFTFLDRDQSWAGFSSFGFNLNIPIFSSFQRRSATQRAKINLEKAEENLKQTEQMLNLEIETAKSNYQFATEDYYNKKDNLKLAESIEQKNQTKFFEGVGSSFELNQAQSQLYTAQQELLQAMLNVITNKVELETLTNNITDN